MLRRRGPDRLLRLPTTSCPAPSRPQVRPVLPLAPPAAESARGADPGWPRAAAAPVAMLLAASVVPRLARLTWLRTARLACPCAVRRTALHLASQPQHRTLLRYASPLHATVIRYRIFFLIVGISWYYGMGAAFQSECVSLRRALLEHPRPGPPACARPRRQHRPRQPRPAPVTSPGAGPATVAMPQRAGYNRVNATLRRFPPRRRYCPTAASRDPG